MNNPGMATYFFSLLMFLFLVSFRVVADDKFTNNFYMSATFMYWCTHKKVPVSKNDIARVADLGHAKEKLTMDLDVWLSALTYEIKNGKLIIINKSKVVSGGKFDSTLTSTSSTDCKRSNRVSNQK